MVFIYMIGDIIMNKAEAKEFLKKYKLYGERLAFIDRFLYETKSISYDYIKGYSNININDNIVERDYILNQMQIIKNAVNSIINIRERYVLTYKYIEGLTTEETAEVMGYCEATIKRIHNCALKEIANIIEARQ